MINRNLYTKTPLIESLPLSQRIKGRVWLKMEALQPTGSFKLRGMSHACKRYASEGAKGFVSSSGGNAGIAVAHVGRRLGIPVTVVVPETTNESAMRAIRMEEADIIVKGKTWQEAHEYALSLSMGDAAYIHPFDDPLIWHGHSTIIDEISQEGLMPDAVVLSVGGGGLLCGILEGLHRNRMSHVAVIAVETKGADSLSSSLAAGRLVELDDITSIATTLGAKKVAESAYEWCRKHNVISHVVSDAQAVDACFRFLEDHRLLVEPACGASLAVVYDPIEAIKDMQNVLVIVCGGAGVTISKLEEWAGMLADQKKT